MIPDVLQVQTERRHADTPEKNIFIRSTFEGSFSVLAKEAGYVLPEDTAIKFGAFAGPEPESPLANTVQEDGGPPPVSEIFAQMPTTCVEIKSYRTTGLIWLTF